MFLKPKETINEIETRIVDNLRALSIDVIDNANSGHPGIALGAAPIIYTLYSKHLKVNPKDPKWINRDRFILSAGHGSSLLYSTLYMAGYDISLEDLKNFRSLKSITPGHPEYGVTPGVDMSTGPLGQGIASSVGMAIGETYLREYFNKKDNIIDYYTYVLCSDGDLMEGVSYEALALAGTLKLNKLIVLYDSNKVCLDGNADCVFNIDVEKYFTSLNWNVLSVNGEDILDIDSAIVKAKQSSLPTVIICNTTIGKGTKLEGTNSIHGSPLSKEEITNYKEHLGIRDIPFVVSGESVEEFRNMINNHSSNKYSEWQKKYDALDETIKKQLDKIRDNDLSLDNLDIDYEVTDNTMENLRESSSKVLNAIVDNNPLFIGGSSDLSSSILTKLKKYDDYNSDKHFGKNINYGVREHAMGAIMNGISLSGIRNYGSTYLAFSDYLKPAIRMASLMNLANVYIFSHDSITVGKDGPTHQPVEQLISLRSIPNLEVFRPNDANEMIGTYKYILAKQQGPSAIVLGRNSTSVKTNTSIVDVLKGAYIVKPEEKNISAIIISNGEDLDVALDVANNLQTKGFDIRVVSMPSIELFKEQKQEYKEKILPFGTKIFVIEASSSYSWYEFVYNEKYLITIDNFGYSGSKEDILNELGFTSDKISEKIENLLR